MGTGWGGMATILTSTGVPGLSMGIGAAGTAVLGIVLMKEPVTGWRIFFLLLLLVSIVGLKLVAPEGKSPPLP